ncbi:MAG: histidine phosphatase family protein [Roseobacter sp.]
MLRLILMRHAKSDWGQARLSDHDRPLNKRGQISAQALGNWLRSKDYVPNQVLSSSSIRTRETVLGLGLAPQTDAQFIAALYHAGPQVMLDILNGATSPCVLMVGHNPGICEMARLIVTAPSQHLRFSDYPTGATLICDFDATDWQAVDWRQGACADFIIPRELIPG